jgi:hypothetical protein
MARWIIAGEPGSEVFLREQCANVPLGTCGKGHFRGIYFALVFKCVKGMARKLWEMLATAGQFERLGGVVPFVENPVFKPLAKARKDGHPTPNISSPLSLSRSLPVNL